MRRLLGVLREDAEGPRRPPRAGGRSPGLRQLTELVDEARDASGAGTRLIVCGRRSPLDPGVELAAYRIVQEALTNARRHAPGAAVDVELRYAAGRAAAAGPRQRAGAAGRGRRRPGGHGLPGMRERAAAVGGALRTGAGAGRRLPGRGHPAGDRRRRAP